MSDARQMALVAQQPAKPAQDGRRCEECDERGARLHMDGDDADAAFSFLCCACASSIGWRLYSPATVVIPF